MRSQKELIVEKGGQLDRKSKSNWYKFFKLSNDRLWCKVRSTWGPIISGTKCVRDKLIICAERRVIKISWDHKIETQKNLKMPKIGVSCVKVSYYLHVCECPPRGICMHIRWSSLNLILCLQTSSCLQWKKRSHIFLFFIHLSAIVSYKKGPSDKVLVDGMQGCVCVVWSFTILL